MCASIVADYGGESDVLLEAVALFTHLGSSPGAAWRESRHGDQARRQSQKLLAVVQDTRHALRDAEQIAGATRTAFVRATREQPCPALRNCLMRSRLSGGVGAGQPARLPDVIWRFFVITFV